MSIKSIAIELLRSRRRAHWAAPKKRIALTSSERKEVEAVWGGSGLNLTMSGMSTTRR